MSDDCPGPGWQRVVLDECDCAGDADIVRTVTIDQLRARVHEDTAAAINEAFADIEAQHGRQDAMVRVVALERARVLIDRRLDVWESSVRSRLAGVH